MKTRLARLALRRLAPALIATLGVALLAAPPSSATHGTHTYTIEMRGDVRGERSTFARFARDTLGFIRGWTLNHNLRYERTGSDASFRLILASPAEVDAAAGYCSPRWSCRVGDQVLINDRRWRSTTPTWPLSRAAYRSYVINHEVGHWLGLGHASCPGAGEDAPVMMQQSQGLDGCQARVWPKYWERAEVARARGIDRWPTPPNDAPCTIEGTDDGERLEGTRHADVICGRDGDDDLRGRGGHDLLRGHRGDDILGSGPGQDWLGGGPGDDRGNGATGDDVLRGHRGGDRLIGGPGSDRLHGEAGHDFLGGRGGADVLRGGGGRDDLRGNAGLDELHGGPAVDHLYGLRDRDRLSGGDGPDQLDGGAGDDVLRGERAADRLLGRFGDDALFGGRQDDRLGGHAGDDLLDGGRATDLCKPGRGEDRVRSCEGG